MSFFHKLTLRNQLLLVVACIVIAGFTLTVSILSRQAAHYQLSTSMNYATELAQRRGSDATALLRQALETARTLAASLGALSATGHADRRDGDAVLRMALQQNPGYIGVWSAWEPNAFDRRDAEFANTPQSDGSGRYLPQFNWEDGQGKIAQGVLADYDNPGPGDYYQVPRKSGKNALLEPYFYDFGGKKVLLTTISVPILHEGRFVGVAGVDISLAGLQEIVKNIRLYDTGYASLLSTQGMFVGDRDDSIVGKMLDKNRGLDDLELTAMLQAIAKGQSLTSVLHDPGLGAEATTIQVPIHIGDIATPWTFAVTLPNHEVLEDIRNLQWIAAILGLASILLTCLGLGVAVNRLVLRPLGGEPADANALAGRVSRGDLSQAINVRPNDNHSLMSQLRVMQDGLIDIISRVRQGADSVALASGQISAGNLDLASRTEEQSSSLAETAVSMEQITATVRQNANNAQQASVLADDAAQVASNGGVLVTELVQTMSDINAKSQEMAEIIDVIDSIAFQTNILALNAAVEAARAGEQGRGFAVVAAEVRALAQRSAASASQVRGLIQFSVGAMAQGNKQADAASASMQGMVDGIRRVTDIISEISLASREQTTGIEQINLAVTQMDDVTRQNASLVEESAAAAASLQQQADTLSQVVSTFKLVSQH
ncbi:methyl-accepting chemotaxis protein [Alcaligenaceae bacterium]|nr:methyl-accepting chemotaxis protein [Alcaligenaceae bacterium]